ncbi:MAG: hypothetical protein BECKG1743E_GA0114224_105124 [Candidatus Kentron sp. G]|nr:MAG: hypothetical protein BECKG1743E_GA0114224_105124 [Candidatus Kentron sp. G]
MTLVSCMQKLFYTPNIVKNSLEMLIYLHGNCAFSLVFASLWDTIRLSHLPLVLGDFYQSIYQLACLYRPAWALQ